MSLELAKSPNKPMAHQIPHVTSGFMSLERYVTTMESVHLELSDFCELVYYGMTNTDLKEGDPRLELLERLKKLSVVEGFNDGGKRLGAI